MMLWAVEYTPDSKAELASFNPAQQLQLRRVIERVALNPLPKNEGGCGNPFGNIGGHNLTGCCKIKLWKACIRVIYKLVRTDDIMKIIVIAARADEQAYELAAKRNAVAATALPQN